MSSQAESRGHFLSLGVLLRGSLRLDQLLRSIGICNELSLADMCSRVRSPHLVSEGAALAFGMLVMARRVQAGFELAGNLDVCEFTPLGRAVGSIAAHGHAGVLEVTVWIGAVGEESTHGLGLVSGPHRR